MAEPPSEAALPGRCGGDVSSALNRHVASPPPISSPALPFSAEPAGNKEAPPCHPFSPCSLTAVENKIHAAVPPANMPSRLANSWATFTQVARHHFPMEGQNPPPANDEEGEESDIE